MRKKYERGVELAETPTLAHQLELAVICDGRGGAGGRTRGEGVPSMVATRKYPPLLGRRAYRKRKAGTSGSRGAAAGRWGEQRGAGVWAVGQEGGEGLAEMRSCSCSCSYGVTEWFVLEGAIKTVCIRTLPWAAMLPTSSSAQGSIQPSVESLRG